MKTDPVPAAVRHARERAELLVAPTAVQRAIDEANEATGGRTVYAPTFSGRPRQLLEQLKTAEYAGVKAGK